MRHKLNLERAVEPVRKPCIDHPGADAHWQLMSLPPSLLSALW
jgi:hypothetical protein